MSNNLKLTIEMVPESSWNNNLRSLLTPVMWKNIRNLVLNKNGNKCLICNRTSARIAYGSESKLHAHEVWDYDDQNKIQTLKDIIPLCYYCHGVKHFGYSSLKSNKEIFIKHFMKVNNCTRRVFQKHLLDENEKFEERSKYEWQLDLSKLKDFDK
jgi:hypothetical protein